MQVSSRKKYLWLPYTSSIKINPFKVLFNYKGGSLEINFSDIHSILFYGETCALENEFLDKCSYYKIPVTLYKRNNASGVTIIPQITTHNEDILTKQILFRENQKKKNYIAKKILKSKFMSMSWLVEIPQNNLYKMTDIKDMLAVESWHAKRYWDEFFKQISFDHSKRRGNNEVSNCLNAVSKFISGIILRWLVYHHFSPFHGYMHTPTSYTSLVYDLMEPYRGYTDKIVFNVFKNLGKGKKNLIYVGEVINSLKEFMDTQVYVKATNQTATFQELYHGEVLALRSYLLGNKRFIIPLPATPNGGRPINAGYKLYGRNAGITNFWPETKEIAKNFNHNLKNKKISSLL